MALAYSILTPDNYASMSIEDYAGLLVDPEIVIRIMAAMMFLPGMAASDFNTHLLATDQHSPGAAASDHNNHNTIASVHSSGAEAKEIDQ